MGRVEDGQTQMAGQCFRKNQKWFITFLIIKLHG